MSWIEIFIYIYTLFTQTSLRFAQKKNDEHTLYGK